MGEGVTYQYRVQIWVTVPREGVGPCEKRRKILRSVTLQSPVPLTGEQVFARISPAFKEHT